MATTSLNSIIGQEVIKQCIDILLKVNDVFPHTMFIGSAGCGKTTFARAIAGEIGSKCHTFNGATLDKPKDILPTILSLSHGDVVFIDEIHRVGKKVQELLYVVMEDFKVDMGCTIPVERFSLIGATTDYGLLTKPFADRFLNTYRLEPYTIKDIITLLYNSRDGIGFNSGVLHDIAKRSRGVPRIALKYFRWVRNFVLAKRQICVTIKDVNDAMTMIGVDANGLTQDDRRYLAFLKTQNKPVGLKTIAAALDMCPETISNTIEPWLLSKGIILRTQYGRKINNGKINS